MAPSFSKTIAFIAGSGLAQALGDILEHSDYRENVPNEFGVVISYYIGYYKNIKIIMLPRHGDSQKIPARTPAELVRQRGYEANIWELHKQGVNEVYGLSAVGVLDHYTPLASTGSFIVPKSFIRGLAASQHSFSDRAVDAHPNMSQPFDETLREKLIQAIELADCSARKEGVYIYNGGDAFETPEEVNQLDLFTRKPSLAQFYERLVRKKRDRLVGMTSIPEAILLKQMKIPFAVLCSNVNYAEGLSKQTLVSHEQTLDVMGVAAPHLQKIVKNIIISQEYDNHERR